MELEEQELSMANVLSLASKHKSGYLSWEALGGEVGSVLRRFARRRKLPVLSPADKTYNLHAKVAAPFPLPHQPYSTNNFVTSSKTPTPTTGFTTPTDLPTTSKTPLP